MILPAMYGPIVCMEGSVSHRASWYLYASVPPYLRVLPNELSAPFPILAPLYPLYPMLLSLMWSLLGFVLLPWDKPLSTLFWDLYSRPWRTAKTLVFFLLILEPSRKSFDSPGPNFLFLLCLMFLKFLGSPICATVLLPLSM